jgi:predicted dehydrogenase
VTTVGLVGCGRWGRHVLRDLLALGCDVPVVARGDASRARAREGGASSIVRSVSELPELAGAVVCTPTTTHAEVVSELLELGVPLYVEKPLTDDPRTARALAEDAPDRIFVMHKWRYHSGIEELGEIARSGELGAVAGVRTARVGWGNPHGDVDGVWMLAPHDISIVLEVLGDIPAARFAVAERVDGVVAGLAGVLGSDPWAAIEVSIAHSERRREVRLICEEGVAVLAEPYAEHIQISRGELIGDITHELELRPISTELPLLRELRAFVDHVQGGPAPKSSAAEGAAEVEAIARLRELAGLEVTSGVAGA